jgi:hypothetical protein
MMRETIEAKQFHGVIELSRQNPYIFADAHFAD